MAGWDSYRRLFFYSIHLIFYFLLCCVQFIYWNLNGVQNHINKCKKGENYESSAQLLKVWFWSEGRLFHVNHQRNFLSTHVRFVHPEYALQKHITLMTVTDKEAIFSIPSPEKDICDVRKWPFMFIAQGPTARHLLVMSTSSLVRLANTLGDPSAKVIWINLTGRCGSTAVMQAFNSLPDVVTISEPFGLFSLLQTYKDKYFGQWTTDWRNSTEYLNLYRSTVRLLLKPNLKERQTIVIKPLIFGSKNDTLLIPRLFPDFSVIFLYRDVREQVLSMCKALSRLDPHQDFTFWVASNRWLSKIFPKVKPLNLVHFSCDDPNHNEWLFSKDNITGSTEFVSFVAHYAETCFHFRQSLSQSAKPVHAFKYEHLQSNQMKYFQTLVCHIGFQLTEARLNLIQDALREDSQKGTLVDKETTKHRRVEITPDMIKETNRYLEHYELPCWGASLTLPNTVSSY